LGQEELGEGVPSVDGGSSWRAFLPLRRVEEDVLVDGGEFGLEEFDGDLGADTASARMQEVEEREAEHAVESMDADFVVCPVVHRTPAEPVTVLETSEDLLDVLLGAVGSDDLLGGPRQAICHDHGATEAAGQELMKRGSIDIELQMPAAVRVGQGWADQEVEELSGLQAARDLGPNLVFGEATVRFGEILREPPKGLHGRRQARAQAVDLLAEEGGGVLQDTGPLVAMDHLLRLGGLDPGLIAAEG